MRDHCAPKVPGRLTRGSLKIRKDPRKGFGRTPRGKGRLPGDSGGPGVPRSPTPLISGFQIYLYDPQKCPLSRPTKHPPRAPPLWAPLGCPLGVPQDVPWGAPRGGPRGVPRAIPWGVPGGHPGGYPWDSPRGSLKAPQAQNPNARSAYITRHHAAMIPRIRLEP